MGVGLLERASTQRFYQEDHLNTELGEQTQRTIFRHKARPLAQQQSTAGVTESTLLATDQAHSLLRTVAQTNPRQLAYNAYGHHPAESGMSRLLGFNGECPETITGHYLLGQGKRAFNPVLMRFNSPDDLSPFGEGGISAYAYCGGDPINFIDPTGNVRILFKPWNPTKVFQPFRPWEPNAVDLSSKAISRSRTSTTAISRSRTSTRNPTLTDLLTEPTPNAARTVPSTSSRTTQAISIEQRLPSTDILINQIPSQFRQGSDFTNLEYAGRVFDNLRASNTGLQTVASQQQFKAYNLTSIASPILTPPRENFTITTALNYFCKSSKPA